MPAPEHEPQRPGPTRRAWLGWAAALSLPGCASAPPGAEPVARGDVAGLRRQVEAQVRHELRADDLAGLSLALVDGPQLLWAAGWGWADRENGRPAHGDTRYRVGSVSKLFTATLAMQAVAEGRCTLDQPMRTLLPDLQLATAWPDAPVTLRQVLTHHAGWPRDRLAGMWAERPDDFRRLPALLQDQAAYGPPGRCYAYSNLGYTLLGLALERLYGEPFERLAQRRLLDPLGMPGSHFSAAVADDAALARAYHRGHAQREPGLRDVPAGGLTASVTELARFMSMQFAGGRGPDGRSVLPERWQREMLQVQNGGIALDAGFEVGLAWHLTTFGEDTVHGGGPVAHHAGATFHHRAQLMLLPEHRLGVVVASNDAAAGGAVSRVAQRALALLLQARTGIGPQPARSGFEPRADGGPGWSAADRQACRGDYQTPAGVLRIESTADALHGQLDGRRLQLVEAQAQRFSVRYRWGGWLPLPLGVLGRMGFECRAVEGHATLVAHLDERSMLVGDRLPAPRLPPGAQELVGAYRPLAAPGEVPSVESVTLQLADGRLWARVQLPKAWANDDASPMALLPDGDGRLLLPGTLADGGEPVRWWRGTDGRVRLQASGWTFEPVGMPAAAS